MPTDTMGGNNFEHTSQIYLVDRSGQMQATFSNAPAADLEVVTTRVIQEKTQ